MTRSPMERAKAGWGETPPDWIVALAEECALTSANKTAKRLGRSAALVSNVLARTYAGDIPAFEARVRKLLMTRMLDCPALGEIGPDTCQLWRDRCDEPTLSNTQAVMMLRACRRCPNNNQETDDE